MIVNDGKTQIKQYFGGQVAMIANSIAFGSGFTAETTADTALEAETYRAPVTSVSADLANNRIVFKVTVQPGYITAFTEIGLFYGQQQNSPGGVLVARKTFATPQTVDSHIPTEIEYSVGITV